MEKIKNEKGVTLTSLIIYIIAMIIVVGIVATITKYFFSNINNINREVDVSKEYTKLNSYLSEDVNNPNNVIFLCDENKIVFYNSANEKLEDPEDQTSGYNQYTFKKEDNAIYFNKIKICKGVKNCIFTQDEQEQQTKFELEITFNNGTNDEETKKVKYAIRRDSNIKVAENEEEIKDIYVTLDTEGTLTFSNKKGKVSEGKTIQTDYEENIQNMQFTSTKLDNGERETNTLWFSDKEKIKQVIFLDKIKPTSTANWFLRCNNLTNIDFENLDTSQVIDMSRMFYGCIKLTNLDLTSLNTSQVTDMVSMFYECTNLTKLDLTSLDTSQVTNMSFMFACKDSNNMNLTEIMGLENFNTANVTDMSGMFWSCTKLTSLDLTSFDTTKVTNIAWMFGTYTNKMQLAEIKGLNNFDTQNVTNMTATFQNCVQLTALDLTSLDTSRVTNMSYMFSGDSKLKTINVGEKWKINNGTNTSYMFNGCGTSSVTKV